MNNRKDNLLILLVCVLMLLLDGCTEDTIPDISSEQVAIELSGAVATDGINTKAVINPVNGLPPYQLAIGIAMFHSDTIISTVNRNVWLNRLDWNRATFGSDTLPRNGEIRFRNDLGQLQRVFYDPTGKYTYLKAVHPYNGAEAVNMVEGGSMFIKYDGSQDVMVSSIGFANMYNPDQMQKLVFRHLMVRLNVQLKADSERASSQYGTIDSVQLVYQPDKVLLDLVEDTVYTGSELTKRYPVLDYPTQSGIADTLQTAYSNFGHILAVPATKYTFRIKTSKRLWFYGELTLPNGFHAGKAYNLYMNFLQSEQLFIYAEEATEWWMDSTFN